MSFRQQRAPRNRRLANLNRPAVLPSLYVSPQTYNGSEVEATLRQIQQPPVNGGLVVTPVITGVPAIRRVSDGAYPISSFLDPATAVLRWAYEFAGPVEAEQFIIGPLDPSIRTETGGYMAPGIIGLPPLLIAEVPYTASANGTNDVTLTYTGFIAYPPLFIAQQIRELASNTFVDHATVIPSGCVLTFGVMVNPGTQIENLTKRLYGFFGPYVTLAQAPVTCS